MTRTSPETWRTWLYRQAFNLWPCLRGTGSRVAYIAPDFHQMRIEIPLSWRTLNRVGTIFGGSLYAAVDPFYMIMLMQILGKDYVVWDKGANIRFKRPGRSRLHAWFRLTPEQVTAIRARAEKDGEYVFDIPVQIVDAQEVVHTEVVKTLYVATKAHYAQKLRAREPSSRALN